MSRANDRRHRLSTALAINAAIVGFNAVLIGLMWYAAAELVRVDRQNTISSAIERNSNLAIALEQYARRTIDNADAAIQFLIREHLRTGNKIDIDKFIADYSVHQKAFTGIVLADERGNVATTAYLEKPQKPVNVADREHFKVHIEQDTGNVFVGKPVVGRITGKPIIPITRRISKPDGAFGGVAMALIETSRFVDVLNQASLRPFDTVALIGFDGITRARLRGTTTSSGEDISKGRLFIEQARNPVGTFTSLGQLDGIPKLFSYRTSPEHRLISVVGSAESDVLAEFHRRKAGHYWSAGVVSMLIAGFAVLLMIALAHQRRSAVDFARSQARFLATFNQAAVGIAHSTLDGHYLEANGKLCDLVGYTREELLARNFADITHPDDIASSIDFRKRLTASPDNAGTRQREKRYVRKNGTAVWCLIAPSVVSDDEGQPDYVATVIQDISERKQAESALRDYAERMRNLSQRLGEIEENERRNINRELHDRVGQNLAILNLSLSRLRAQEGPPEDWRKILDDAQAMAESTIVLIRNVMADLRPPALDDFGLLAALRNHVNAYAARTGLAVELKGSTIMPRPPLATETALFRIAQEALTNVSKHANAKRVEVNLQQFTERISLTVTDDGVGFEAGDTDSPRASWGLGGMRERAEAIGATLRIESGRGKGTRVTVEMRHEAAA